MLDHLDLLEPLERKVQRVFVVRLDLLVALVRLVLLVLLVHLVRKELLELRVPLYVSLTVSKNNLSLISQKRTIFLLIQKFLVMA